MYLMIYFVLSGCSLGSLYVARRLHKVKYHAWVWRVVAIVQKVQDFCTASIMHCNIAPQPENVLFEKGGNKKMSTTSFFLFRFEGHLGLNVPSRVRIQKRCPNAI